MEHPHAWVSIHRIWRHTLRWLLVVSWAVFVVGGFAAGYSALHRFDRLERPAPPKPAPLAALPTSSPYPALRDFDNSPPPFAAAGAPDVPVADAPPPLTLPELARRTVVQVFGVPVDRYALVDIHSMETVIDTLGGVQIDNPRRLVDTQYPTDDYRTITIDIPAGTQVMDGPTAVEHARTRHADSDYGRQARQQQVLLAVLVDQALALPPEAVVIDGDSSTVRVLLGPDAGL